MRIYLTHCSAKKETGLQHTTTSVSPDVLYTATPTKRFMKKCRETKVAWAILSDKFGVWFPHAKHEWYEKDPATITDEEFKTLLDNFNEQFQGYDQIFFYHNPGRFHRLYRRLTQETQLRDRVHLFSHLSEIA